MKKVYESPDFHRVGHLKSILEEAGIRCAIRNVGGSSVMGEVPFVEVFPELWVVDDRDEDTAREMVRERREEMASASGAPEWICGKCGEPVPGNFETCWNCGAGRPVERG